MKRSEWLRLMDFRDDLYSDGGGWYPDDREAGYYDGKEAAYESARDSMDELLGDAVIDVEDVMLCPSTTVFPDTETARVHALGSKPYAFYSALGKHGCQACLEHFNATVAKA